MKIKNKLLPIFGLTSVAIASPFIASCSQQVVEDEWTATWKTEDGLWKPTVKSITGQSFVDEDAALNAFLDGAKKNNILLSEELVSSHIIQETMKLNLDPQMPVKSYDFIGTKEISFDTTNAVASYSFERVGWDRIPFGSWQDQYIDFRVDVTNIKLKAESVHVYYEEDDETVETDIITIMPENNYDSLEDTVDAWLNASEEWEVDMSLKFQKFSELDFTFKFNKQYIRDCIEGLHYRDALSTMVALFGELNIYSYYLIDCSIGE